MKQCERYVTTKDAEARRKLGQPLIVVAGIYETDEDGVRTKNFKYISEPMDKLEARYKARSLFGYDFVDIEDALTWEKLE